MEQIFCILIDKKHTILHFSRDKSESTLFLTFHDMAIQYYSE